jgi:hypothetical protein
MTQTISRLPALIGGVAVGALAMYLLDPNRGGRRRAMVRDQAVRIGHDVEDFLGKAGRDLRHRGKGLVAETRGRWRRDRSPDEVLVERVRSKIGRYVSHARAIEVAVDEGRVTLSGPILSHEVDGLLSAISKVHGVSAVDNQLEGHDRSENIPALQGGATPPGEPAEWAQAQWSPALQLMAGVVGGAAVLYGASMMLKDRNHEPALSG